MDYHQLIRIGYMVGGLAALAMQSQVIRHLWRVHRNDDNKLGRALLLNVSIVTFLNLSLFLINVLTYLSDQTSGPERPVLWLYRAVNVSGWVAAWQTKRFVLQR